MFEIKNADYPPLDTERMNLRILTLENSKDVFIHFSDKDVTRFMDIEPCKGIYEAEEIIKFHMEDYGCRWGMYDNNNNKFIGTIGFHCLRKNKNYIAEVGFDLAKEYWGKGFMSEAIKEVILFGFTKMGLDTIDATVEPANESSLHLMKKLGFKEDEELKDGLVYFYLKKNDM